MKTIMLQINKLKYHYHKSKPLFEGLNLDIQPGNIYGLLGRNGAGKSTLLKLMTGLLFPKEGEIRLLGHNPANRSADLLADIFFLPEELYVPSVSISSFVEGYSDFYPNFDRKDFDRYLSEFAIPTDHRMDKMSYGQKKKTLISFALATNAKLLIFDEPTNGLDIPSKTKFRKILTGAVSENQTIFISTHQVRDMANLLDPIIILDTGKIIFNQPLEKVTQRLQFELISTMTEPQGALYSERVPGGFYVVNENTTGSETEPDLEILFNAIVANPQKMKELFPEFQATSAPA